LKEELGRRSAHLVLDLFRRPVGSWCHHGKRRRRASPREDSGRRGRGEATMSVGGEVLTPAKRKGSGRLGGRQRET
jgi:hypothetical protein